MTYPLNLAAGVTAEGTFDPQELFAGDIDVATDHGTCGTNPVSQFQVVGRDEDGTIVPFSDLTGAASLAGTFTGAPTAADTVTINGVVFTARASGAVAHEYNIGGNVTATAANLAAAINASPEDTHVRAVPAAGVITLYSLVPGFGGNNIAVAESTGNFTFAGSATALAGGTDQSDATPVGIACFAATSGMGLSYYTGGVFNHLLLVWPAEITTLAQRKKLFDRTNIQIDTPKGVSTRMVIP